MNKSVQLLDCTLRDGGRLFDCKFQDYEISEICNRLSKSNINIVEIGFLRDTESTNYIKDSTFFTDINQMKKFIPKASCTEFVAFADYGLFDVESLPVCDGSSITGLRVGFTKKNYISEKANIVSTLLNVKAKGYKLYVQGVNTLGYSDEELLAVLEMINEIKPYSFGIVDTYGAMFPKDVSHLFNLVNSHLLPDIALDFHAHNNKQLAFANAMCVLDLCPDNRTLIIDGTLEGIGKCAGNLNTELIVNYLADELNQNYDFDEILDIIDEYIHPLKNKYSWGYSIPALMGGLYKSHPNNIIYLFNKFRLSCKDFKNILSMIDPDLRQRYDYDNLERLYWEYNNMKINDMQALNQLEERYHNKSVLVKAPGHTLIDYSEQLKTLANSKHLEIVTVSFTESGSVCFLSNKRRYDKLINKNHESGFILTSNVTTNIKNGYVVNFNALVDRKYKYYDNSVIMLLNLLKKLHVSEIYLAGFDGFTECNNYFNDSFSKEPSPENLEKINSEISIMLKNFIKVAEQDIKITIVTPTKYL